MAMLGCHGLAAWMWMAVLARFTRFAVSDRPLRVLLSMGVRSGYWLDGRRGARCGQAGARWLARRARVSLHPALCSLRRASVANGP